MRAKATKSAFVMTPIHQPPPWTSFQSHAPWNLRVATARRWSECPNPPPTSFDDEGWDDVDWNDIDWDEQYRDCTPFFTPPQSPTPIDFVNEPQTDTIKDLITDNSALPCAVVEQVRHKFMQDAPFGVSRVFTPGTELLCGLQAAQLSMKYQPNFHGVRQPTMKELLEIWEEFQKSGPEGNENNNFFEATQLTRITQTYLGRQGIASRLGIVSPSMGQNMFPVIYSDMEEYKDADKVLWVYNDEKGTHWEALRPTESDTSVDMERYRRTLTGAAFSGGTGPFTKYKSTDGTSSTPIPQPESMAPADTRPPSTEAPNKPKKSPQLSKGGFKFISDTLGASTIRALAPHVGVLARPFVAHAGSESTALTTTTTPLKNTRIRRKTLSEGATTNYGDTPITMSSLLGLRMVDV